MAGLLSGVGSLPLQDRRLPVMSCKGRLPVMSCKGRLPVMYCKETEGRFPFTAEGTWPEQKVGWNPNVNLPLTLILGKDPIPNPQSTTKHNP